MTPLSPIFVIIIKLLMKFMWMFNAIFLDTAIRHEQNIKKEKMPLLCYDNKTFSN